MDAYWATTSVDEPDAARPVRLQPHPARDFVEVSGSATGAYATLVVLDALGTVVQEPRTVPVDGSFRAGIDTRQFAPGVYFMRIGDAAGKWISVLFVVFI